MKTRYLPISLLSIMLLTLNAGYAQDNTQQEQQEPPKLPVGVVTVTPQTIELTKNLPGRLEALRDTTVRARVTGVVEKRFFKEGSYVKAGQPLFQIDSRELKAGLTAAQAQLAQAQATRSLNLKDVKRYRRLLKSKAISRQLYDQAQAQLATTDAAIKTAKATITQAKLNIAYANVNAPIDGYIGQAQVTEGTLVSAASSTPMVQIQQIDPLYIGIKQPATQVIKLKQMAMKNNTDLKDIESMSIAVKVFFDDGTPYHHDGQLLFANVNIEPTTGEASLRARLPNPERLLMPGLYVRVEVPQASIDNAVLIPQQAVTRGKVDTVFVLNDDNSYTLRPITIVQSQNNQWLVSDGLNAGDRVIVDGMQKVLMMRLKTVTPVPFGEQAPQGGQ